MAPCKDANWDKFSEQHQHKCIIFNAQLAVFEVPIRCTFNAFFSGNIKNAKFLGYFLFKYEKYIILQINIIHLF